MANEYLELMQLRKLALLKGDEELAFTLMEAAEELIKARAVSDDEIKAAGYL